MKVLDIKNIIRKDVPIYYRNYYTGTAVMELVNKPQEMPVEFQIEHKPTGQTEINVNLVGEINYPLVPLIKELKNYIGELDSGRRLPL